MGWAGDELVMEVHPILEVAMPELDAEDQEETAEETAKDPLTYVTERFIATTAERAGQLDWHLVEQLVKRSDGIPMPVGQEIKNAAASAASE
jgi:hypothetical protein